MSIEYKYTHVQFASLMERTRDFVSSAVSSRTDETFKFKGLMLIVETHNLASNFHKGRLERLTEYFENVPLYNCLDCIRIIDIQKEDIQRRLYPLLNISEGNVTDEDFSNHDHNVFFKKEIETESSLSDLASKAVFPDIEASQLWNARKPKKIGHAFYQAFENLNSKDADNIDEGFNSHYIQEDLKQHQVSNLDLNLLNETQGLDVLEYLQRIRNVVKDLTLQQIYNELMRGLEQLRIAFMETAHDIYCVRTGDNAIVSGKEGNATYDICYTELPLKKYYEERDERREDVAYELTQDVFDEWRRKNHITNRELCNEEYIRFLTEQKDKTVKIMQEKFADLWTLREHSGGYDVDVNPENFARMFYGRKGIDRRFFELQWEYEYIDELIVAKKTENAPQAIIEQWSPEELAINTFVEKQIRLVNDCHTRYNEKQCSPGVHQPAVTVEIKKEALIDYLHQQMEDKDKPLRRYCFPTTSKSNKLFCDFVVELKKAGYYGKLPNKELAQALAPIVGLELGTVTNYLSQG